MMIVAVFFVIAKSKSMSTRPYFIFPKISETERQVTTKFTASKGFVLITSLQVVDLGKIPRRR